VSCYRIPSLITTTNGTLIAAIDERNNSCGDLKWNRDINIVIRKSFDSGKTWTKIEKIVDYPMGESASDPSMIVDQQTKEIFLFYNYMNLDEAKDVYRFMVIKSSNNGKNWSSPVEITSEIIKDGWEKDFMFITSGRGTQTKDGILLHCLVNLNKGTHVFGSKDHGKTWFLNESPINPGDESKILELSNGDWLINSRVNSDNSRYSHISKDKGISWATFKNYDLPDPGCNASLINYNKNYLLFSNAFDSKSRINLALSVSKDQGKTWKENLIIYKGKSAYSSMTKLKNGDIGLLFEKDDYSKNVFVRIPKDRFIKN
jgi:sialidase-1